MILGLGMTLGALMISLCTNLTNVLKCTDIKEFLTAWCTNCYLSVQDMFATHESVLVPLRSGPTGLSTHHMVFETTRIGV